MSQQQAAVGDRAVRLQQDAIYCHSICIRTAISSLGAWQVTQRMAGGGLWKDLAHISVSLWKDHIPLLAQSEVPRALLGASRSSCACRTWIQGTNTKPSQSKANMFFQPLGCGLQDWEAQLLLWITMAEEHQMMGAKHYAWKRESENTVHNLLICLGRDQHLLSS